MSTTNVAHKKPTVEPRREQRADAHYHIDAASFNKGSNMNEMVEIQGRNNHVVVQNQAEKDAFALIEQVVMQGDLSKLNPEQRVCYYRKVCESMGLNPYTRPFDYILLNGKLTLYAKKDCTEQLRKINGVSIEGLEDRFVDDLYIVKAFAKTKDGRTDASTGAVTIGHLKGEAKANAIMKAETKAKRRVTLSISGMGLVDETELESIPSAKRVEVDMNTGEISNSSAELNTTCSPSKGNMTINSPQSSQSSKVLIDSSRELNENPPAKALSMDQVHELEDILAECEERYRKTVYAYLKHVYGFDTLVGAPEELYVRIKNAAMQNAREFFDRKSNAMKTEMMVTA